MSIETLILGFIAGVTSGGGVAKKATMYSYNGVVLPKLPEWDKTKYRYVYSFYEGGGRNYWLVAYQTPLVVTSYYEDYYGEGIDHIGMKPEQVNGEWPDSIGWSCKEYDTSWGEPREGVWYNGMSQVFGSNDVYDYFWCNTNVANSEGTVYYFASDPIPVYE